MLNKTTIVFLYIFVLNVLSIKAQPQIISLCDVSPIYKKYWVESIFGYDNTWSIYPDVEYQTQQDNTIVVKWSDPGMYTMVAQYVNGDCSSKTEFKIQVEECPDIFIYIPNSFTPNNDNLNDIFEAYGIGIIEFNMVVFNRWGELIFESNKIEKRFDGLHMGGWNGLYQLTPCQDDTYVYSIRYKGRNNKDTYMHGKVLLIR
jgi:gliding motility-associated-like protein